MKFGFNGKNNIRVKIFMFQENSQVAIVMAIDFPTKISKIFQLAEIYFCLESQMRLVMGALHDSSDHNHLLFLYSDDQLSLEN